MPEWKKRKAKKMAKNQTPPEKALWKHLRNKKLGVWFYKQRPMCGYIVDFWCALGIVVEVDGKCHRRRKAYDRRRDAVFHKRGIDVLRFSAQEVMRNPAAVVAVIRGCIEGRK